MQTRRHFLAALAVSVLTITAGQALAAPPGARGSWTTADVQAVLGERMK